MQKVLISWVKYSSYIIFNKELEKGNWELIMGIKMSKILKDLLFLIIVKLNK